LGHEWPIFGRLASATQAAHRYFFAARVYCTAPKWAL
jgi:hypothetical protein